MESSYKLLESAYRLSLGRRIRTSQAFTELCKAASVCFLSNSQATWQVPCKQKTTSLGLSHGRILLMTINLTVRGDVYLCWTKAVVVGEIDEFAEADAFVGC